VRRRSVAVCMSKEKGTVKEDVGEALLVEGLGLVGDAHAGFMHRQVSLLALEDIEKCKKNSPILKREVLLKTSR